MEWDNHDNYIRTYTLVDFLLHVEPPFANDDDNQHANTDAKSNTDSKPNLQIRLTKNYDNVGEHARGFDFGIMGELTILN
jgi:hypothetical protein